MKQYGIFFLLFSLAIGGCSHLTKAPSKAHYRVLWTKNLDSSYDTGNLPISFHSPFIHDGLLFLGSPKGIMTAYNVESGREIWEKKEDTAISNQASVFEDNLFYGTSGGRLVVRNYATGELKYEVDLGESVEASVIFDKGRGFVQLRNHSIVAFDAQTGKTLWSYKRSITQSTTIQQVATPAVYQDRLYVGFSDGVLAAFNTEEGKVLWETNLAEGTKFVDVNMTPTFKGKLLYAGSLSGPLTILNSETGEFIHKYPFQVLKTPIWEGDDLLVGTHGGEVIRTNTEGITKKSLLLDSTVFAVTKVSNFIVAATRDGRIVFLNPQSFQIEDTFHLGHAFSLVFGHLVAHENKLAALSSRNRLYVFEIL